MELQLNDLTLSELELGYTLDHREGCYCCVFCGECFEDGIIYHSKGRMVSAKKAVKEHIEIEHDGIFDSLISLDKRFNGLSDVQKRVMTLLYSGKDNKAISEEMDISIATVRSHKFNLQKAKKEAMILLTLLKEIESVPQETATVEPTGVIEGGSDDSFSIDTTLHPFFKRYI